MANGKLAKEIWLNCAVVAGIIIGLSTSGQSLSAQAASIVAVFFFALFNLLFLEAQPRLAQKATTNRSDLYKEACAAMAERPVITVLVIFQLWAAARCLGTVISFCRAYSAPQIVSQNLQGKTVMFCTAMAFVGLLWLVSAAGIWHRRVWAWWLALVLNGVDAGTTTLVQLFAPHQFLVDIIALLAIALLLLPRTRLLFRTQVPVSVLPTS
jgi:hypothetical protein